MLQFVETTRVALRSLRRNVLRSALTTLGIVIGVSAVITMIEIGQGSARAIRETIARMGANNLLIQSGAASSGGITLGGGSGNTLLVSDLEALEVECAEYIAEVAPIVRARTQVVYGNKNWVPFYLYGTSPAYPDVRQWPLEEGSFFTEQDVRNSVPVCVLGQTLVRELFPDSSPVGQDVRINNQPFRVIGTLEGKGADMVGFDQDDTLLAPWTTVKYKVAGESLQETNQSVALPIDTASQVNSLNERYPGLHLPLYPVPSTSQTANYPQANRLETVDRIALRVSDGVDMQQAKKDMSEVLRRKHRLRDNEANDFNIRDMTEQSAAMGSSSAQMGSLLLAVALISLVVGGVGIMNIMLVTVTERTREIGLRMAVGARPRDILRQFLIEAVILCLLGAALGVVLGRGGSAFMNYWKQWPVESSTWAVVASVSSSVLVGVVFGYYPAWKASRLDPIQALRYE
ncbi:MAG: ABC transporter permease [Planctomycetaceae bacterium]|nr:ABC transporter permease [Planctomycetaceae bacterium]